MFKGFLYMYYVQDNEIYELLLMIIGNWGGLYNVLIQIYVKFIYMVGGYGQLLYGWNYYGLIGNQWDLYVNVRKLKKVNWNED